MGHLKAAEQGYAEGQFHIGAMYYNEHNDHVPAYMWLSLAAAQGKEEAIEAKAQVEGEMTPDQIAEAKRLAKGWKPTKNQPELSIDIEDDKLVREFKPTQDQSKEHDAEASVHKRGRRIKRGILGTPKK